MAGHGAKIGRKQEVAIAALLTQPTIQDAAAKAGVDGRTLKRWLALPDFQAAYRAARHEILDRTVVQLLGACKDAVDTLKRNLHCGKYGPENRAAVAILELGNRLRATEEMEARIAALERIAEEQPR
jgi:hypothetical protein